MIEQTQKFERFKALHFNETAFVVPNPWDAGSARILTSLGFDALATTSAGYAFSVGKRDSYGGLTREELLENAKAIVEATDLPVTADLEDGFGATPEACAETMRLAAAIGLVGGSIEDASGNEACPIREMAAATDRVVAAVDAIKDKPFLLTARADNFICGYPDLADTICRLQAYSEAGADVLYAPGLPDLDAIRTVCAEVDKPVNVVMGLQGATFTVDMLSAAGVRRISVGGSLARTALGAMRRAAQEIMMQGTFSYAADAIPDAELASLMSQAKLGRDEHG